MDFFVTFLSLVKFQLGGAWAPFPWLRLCSNKGKQKWYSQIFHEVSGVFQQNFNCSKNSAVLEPRTGQFSRTWGFEAKAKDFKMCPRGLYLCWNLMYRWSENDGTSLTCQPTTRSHAHRFTKVKSRISSRDLVLNVGLLPTLQKFRSALTQYASRSSPRGFISEDPHVV